MGRLLADRRLFRGEYSSLPRYAVGAALILFLFSGLPGLCPPAAAQQSSQNSGEGSTVTIQEIRLEGVRVWSRSDLRDLIQQVGLEPGETMNRNRFEQRVDMAMDRLLKEELFSDIQVRLEDDVLIFQFEEYPRVTGIQFEGNQAFENSKLNGAILLQTGDPATRQKIRSARRELENFYRSRGYLSARVESEVQTTEPGRARVSFQIDEGSQEVITDVFIEYAGGKSLFSQFTQNWSLKWVLPLKPGMPYSPQNIQDARRAITQWYHQRGHLKVEIDQEVMRAPREDGVEVTLVIDEGPIYTFESVRFANNTVFSDTELQSMVTLQPGDVFDKLAFFQSLQEIEKRYHDRGYANASVFDPSRFQIRPDHERQDVATRVRITEGKPFYVERIEIRGNQMTYTEVIRREITLEEGELLDGEKRRNSLRRLRNLGFFEKVEMNVDPGSRENTKIVRVRVKEGRTGQLQFGGGFSSSTGFVGNFSVRKDNFSLWDPYNGFTGRGQSLSTSVQIGDQRDNLSISWNDPWFNDDLDEPGSPEIPMGFGWSLFDQTLDRIQGFDETRTGGSISLSREFGAARANQIDLSYSFRDQTVEDLLDSDDFDDVPLSLFREAGGSDRDLCIDEEKFNNRDLDPKCDSFERSVGSMTLGLQRDLRNQRYYPTEGYFLRGSIQVASDFLGGNSTFYQPDMEGRWYIPFLGPTSWAVRLNYRTLDTWKGEDAEEPPIPAFEEFFLGGNRDIRGFEFRDIAIYRNIDSDDEFEKFSGGRSAWFTNLEYRIELVEQTANFFFFTDIGQVSENSWAFEADNLKKSAGIGLRVRSPLGPINISWGQRLDETFPGADDVGETQIDFNVGQGF